MALPVEKPYDNKLCDDTFRWLSSSHIQDRIHTREKPQECQQSEEVFVSSKDINKISTEGNPVYVRNAGTPLFILIPFRHMKEFTQEWSPLPVNIVEKLLLIPGPF
jgi:hypothetical protein